MFSGDVSRNCPCKSARWVVFIYRQLARTRGQAMLRLAIGNCANDQMADFPRTLPLPYSKAYQCARGVIAFTSKSFIELQFGCSVSRFAWLCCAHALVQLNAPMTQIRVHWLARKQVTVTWRCNQTCTLTSTGHSGSNGKRARDLLQSNHRSRWNWPWRACLCKCESARCGTTNLQKEATLIGRQWASLGTGTSTRCTASYKLLGKHPRDDNDKQLGAAQWRPAIYRTSSVPD